MRGAFLCDERESGSKEMRKGERGENVRSVPCLNRRLKKQGECANGTKRAENQMASGMLLCACCCVHTHTQSKGKASVDIE